MRRRPSSGPSPGRALGADRGCRGGRWAAKQCCSCIECMTRMRWTYSRAPPRLKAIATPADCRTDMTAHDPLSARTADVLHRFNQAFLTHDPSLLAALIAPDCVVE